ncbi:MAG: hypothetical protein R3F54_30355 [Alphaproteobacteria bacterium]
MSARKGRRFASEDKAEPVEFQGIEPNGAISGVWKNRCKTDNLALRLVHHPDAPLHEEASGRSLRSAAEDLGVHAGQRRSWRNGFPAAGTAGALAKEKAEAAEPARLRRANRRLGQSRSPIAGQ